MANEPASGVSVSGCMHVLTELKNLFLKQSGLELASFKRRGIQVYVIMTEGERQKRGEVHKGLNSVTLHYAV